MSHFYKPHFKGSVATLEVVATLLSSGDLKNFLFKGKNKKARESQNDDKT